MYVFFTLNGSCHPCTSSTTNVGTDASYPRYTATLDEKSTSSGIPKPYAR